MIIIQDTREKKGWDFTFARECDGQIIQMLKTGDYTIQGLESKLCVERKRSVSEIAINLGSKWSVFKEELERMKAFEHRYIICEFSIDDILIFPANSSIPKWKQKKIKMNGKFMLNRLNSIYENYGINIEYCNNSIEATHRVLEIFKNVFFSN